jgi:3-hydroxyisobutyrate dehydrogenase
MSTIAFIGLGNMGAPMAANLVKAGHRVVGFDLVADLLRQAALRGVEAAASGPAALADAEIVITMLPAGRHVVACWQEILPAARKSALFIDCSTIDVASSRRAHALGG